MKTIVNKPNVVQLMRNIRDEFSKEIQNMTLQEQKEYMKNILQTEKMKKPITQAKK